MIGGFSINKRPLRVFDGVPADISFNEKSFSEVCSVWKSENTSFTYVWIYIYLLFLFKLRIKNIFFASYNSHGMNNYYSRLDLNVIYKNPDPNGLSVYKFSANKVLYAVVYRELWKMLKVLQRKVVHE